MSVNNFAGPLLNSEPAAELFAQNSNISSVKPCKTAAWRLALPAAFLAIMPASIAAAAALSGSTKLTFQHIENPAYNTDKGPVNLFTGRFRWAF